jgi:hypothetical protein
VKLAVIFGSVAMGTFSEHRGDESRWVQVGWAGVRNVGTHPYQSSRRAARSWCPSPFAPALFRQPATVDIVRRPRRGERRRHARSSRVLRGSRHSVDSWALR